jgi:hypothetical protein
MAPRKFNLNSKVSLSLSIRVALDHQLTNTKTVAAPLAAFSMACILFVYARTSIHAAKLNAQQHREADGGQINWHNESLRRHGRLEPPVEQESLKQLVGIAREKALKDSGGKQANETEEERRVKEVSWRKA